MLATPLEAGPPRARARCRACGRGAGGRGAGTQRANPNGGEEVGKDEEGILYACLIQSSKGSVSLPALRQDPS